ncbi:MAG: hypothetical protein JNM27_12490 [Leptospirales bacterium]|nr:hypothetical protein [Leptospirales bacterium]
MQVSKPILAPRQALAVVSLTLLTLPGCQGKCPDTLNSGSWNPLVAYSATPILRELKDPESLCRLQVDFPDGTSIHREPKSREAILKFKTGPSSVLVSDLLYLIEASSRQSLRAHLSESGSLQEFLDQSLRAQSLGFRNTFAPNGDDWFGGNVAASNGYASGSFNYRVVEQLHSDQKAQKAMKEWRAHPEWHVLPNALSMIDPEVRPQFDARFGVVRGLECHAATAMHLFKALGLVRPDMDRPALEHAYTQLHSGQIRRGVLPSGYNRTLQGYYDSAISASMIADMANILSHSSWAVITGANHKPYRVQSVTTLAGVQKLTEEKQTIYAWLSPRGGFAGHSYLITSAKGKDLRVDESFAWQPAKRVIWVDGGYSSLIYLK